MSQSALPFGEPVSLPLGWCAGSFLIAVKRGTREVRGYVSAYFGVHQERAGWRVTHLPSGRWADVCGSHQEALGAIAVADVLARQANDWVFDPADEDSEAWSKFGERCRAALAAAFPDLTTPKPARSLGPTRGLLNGFGGRSQ